MKFATPLVSVLIVIAVLIPGKDLPDVDIGGYDKLIHLVMFATWALAVRFDYRQRWSTLVVFVAGVVFSLLTEVLQIQVEGRTFDLVDATADAAGLLTGLLLSPPFLRLVERIPWLSRLGGGKQENEDRRD